MADADEYVDLGRAFIMSTLAEHHAVVRPELESRIGERYYTGDTRNLDPHHVSPALRGLINEGLVTRTSATARGGRTIETLQLTDRTGRATKIDRAAARKRVLYARYRGWAEGTARYSQGLIGPAGEKAVRDAIMQSSTLVPLTPGAGEATEILGVKLNGPVDSAGYLVPVVGGLPQQPVTTLIEVKNIRSWVYPRSRELYQVLDKAAQVQLANPSQPVLPILVCRRAHVTLFYMASQLGFVVIEMGRQFAGTAMPAEDVDEVRTELHFRDLHHGAGPSRRVEDRLRSIRPHVIDYAWKWQQTAADLGHLIAPLRAKLSNADRDTGVATLRAASTARGDRGGW